MNARKVLYNVFSHTAALFSSGDFFQRFPTQKSINDRHFTPEITAYDVGPKYPVAVLRNVFLTCGTLIKLAELGGTPQQVMSVTTKKTELISKKVFRPETHNYLLRELRFGK